MKYIVYKITNLLNKKVYIGQTTESLEKRWKRHCGYQLNDNTYLHRAMKKYGVENFKIEKIDETISQDELNKLELYYIKLFENNSYNTILAEKNVVEIHYLITKTEKIYAIKFHYKKDMTKIQMLKR